MAEQETAVFTNMCMVYNGEKILVQDRVDPDWPGVTFPGGHVKPKESFVESAVREIYEETGLKISNLQLCGLKQWTHKDGLYRYIVIFYKTNVFSGEIKSSDEGKVFWINRSEIDNYILADGFKSMLEVFESCSLSENYHWFENGVWKEKNI